MDKIAQAFVKAKRAFGPALKDKTNPAFRSKYADLGACIDAVEDALLANGIAFIQETYEDSSGVTVQTVFIHESGETMPCGKLHVPAAKQDPQGYGSALTYARRYSLMAACGIAPEDDDGNAATKAHREQHTKAIPALATAAADSPVPDEDKPYLDELAADLTKIFNEKGREAAYERMAIEGLDNEQKLYLSTKLSSAVRNGVKAVSLARNAQKAAS